jgi:hypothetical protein
LEFSNGPEVDEVADRLFGDSHVVDDLGFVIWTKVGNRLEFDNDFLEDQEIGNVPPLEFFSLVIDRKFLFSEKWDATQFELQLQTLLIDFFRQSAALNVMHLERGPHQVVAFLSKRLI